MKKKPKCKKWHSNDVMPREDRGCIFEVNNNDRKLFFIGYRRGDFVVKYNGYYELDMKSIVRWCYIDLN